jgi:hypothetical protein
MPEAISDEGVKLLLAEARVPQIRRALGCE